MHQIPYIICICLIAGIVYIAIHTVIITVPQALSAGKDYKHQRSLDAYRQMRRLQSVSGRGEIVCQRCQLPCSYSNMRLVALSACSGVYSLCVVCWAVCDHSERAFWFERSRQRHFWPGVTAEQLRACVHGENTHQSYESEMKS